MKKIILSLAFFFMLLGFRTVSANIIINEVQIDGVNKNDEFIELYNSDSSDIDLTDWYISKKSSSGSETIIVSKSHFKNKFILGNDYLLLGKEGGYAGNGDIDIFWPSSDSYGLAKNNSLILYNRDGVIKDEVNWENIENGKSFQKISSGWIVASPTPGVANEDNYSGDPISVDKEEVTLKKEELEKKKKEIPTIDVAILTNDVYFAGEPFKIKANISGFLNEKIVLGRAYWSFGDGTSFEQKNDFSEFQHIYYYPGEYLLVMEYYKTNSIIPDIVKKIKIKVLPTTVIISNIGDKKNFFIELTNNAVSDIDISNWYIKTNNKVFIFPKNTIMLSKKSMIVSPVVTGIRYEDRHDLKLFSATNELIFDYSNGNIDENIYTKKSIIINKNDFIKNENISENSKDLNLIKEDNIAGSALYSSPVLAVENNENVVKKQNKSYFFFWGFVILLVISCGAVYYIRQIKNDKNQGEDFEILDE